MVNIKKLNTLLTYIFIILFYMANINGNFLKIYNTSIFLILNFIIIVILSIINYKNVFNDNKKNILFLIIIILSIMTSTINENGLGSFINFFNFIVGVYVFSAISFNKQGTNLIYILTTICFLSNIILSKNIWNEYLNRTNIVNPNSVAFCILCCIIIIFSKINSKRNFKNRIIKIAIFIIGFIGIYKCNSRGSLLGLLVFGLIQSIPLLENITYKKRTLISIIIIIIGTVFPIIYVQLYLNDINFVVPFSEKSLYTGREILWFNMLNSFENPISIIFGLGSNYITKIGIINNFHNWYLGVIYTFGILEYIAYFFMIIYTMKNIKSKEITSGFISLLVLGFFESVALYFVAQIFLIIFLIIDKYKSKIGSE